jgi:hypothetical protein
MNTIELTDSELSLIQNALVCYRDTCKTLSLEDRARGKERRAVGALVEAAFAADRLLGKLDQ